MEYVICPKCKEILFKSADLSWFCKYGHRFQAVDGVLDLLPTTADKNIIEEQDHWDSISKKGQKKVSNRFIKNRMVRHIRENCEEVVAAHINHNNVDQNSKYMYSDYRKGAISIGEIGCGSGSAITYLRILQSVNIEYYGIDVSLNRLIHAVRASNYPASWQINFIRASANTQTFANESFDIIFSAAALHHLKIADVLDWVSKSLKKGGILILCEPSLRNPFASIGRKMLKGFHTTGERPLEPPKIQRLAEMNGLQMVYQKGEHFLTGPMDYLFEILAPPAAVIVIAYYTARILDLLVRSPSINYRFIQAYKKA